MKKQRRSVPGKERRELFKGLVEMQDRYPGMGVEMTRSLIAIRHGVTEDFVKEIEKVGIENDWPMPKVGDE
jgi:hypothetical protein